MTTQWIRNNGNAVCFATEFGRRRIDPSMNVVLIRCYGKGKAELEALMNRMEKLRQLFPFDALIMCIDGDLDNGRTISGLSQVSATFEVVPLLITGPKEVRNWTRLLNGGLAWLHHVGVTDGKILVCSAETEIDLNSFSKVSEKILSSERPVPCISYRRTPEVLMPSLRAHLAAYDTPEALAFDVLEESIMYVGGTSDHIGNRYEMLALLWRNTAMVWRLKHLFEMKGFDPRCNGWGGQEEIAHMLRLMGIYNLIPTQAVQYDALFAYDDPRLSVVTDEQGQRTKIETEWSSIKTIHETYRTVGPFSTPDFVFA